MSIQPTAPLQVQLALFDGGGEASPLPMAPVPQAAVAFEPASPAVAAPTLPTPATPMGLVPTVHRHPQADRHITLGGLVVHYQMLRVRRKSIGLIVGSDGLVVRAPRWVPLHEIESALLEKSRWIVKRLQDQADRARKLESARIVWADGVGLPFLGETVILVLDPRATGAMLNTDAEALPGVPRLTLHLGLPQHASAHQIRDLAQAWLQRQAKRVFEERIQHFSKALGVSVTRLTLSNAQTNWGSASADGSVRLNWRLVHFAMSTIDYVVAHELAHLRVMDHSPRFWDVVRSVIPDLDQRKAKLRDPVLPVFD